MHCRFTWRVGIFNIFQRPPTVSCAALTAGNLPAVSAVHKDCEIVSGVLIGLMRRSRVLVWPSVGQSAIISTNIDPTVRNLLLMTSAPGQDDVAHVRTQTSQSEPAARLSCNIWYPSEIHLKLKSYEISFAHSTGRISQLPNCVKYINKLCGSWMPFSYVLDTSWDSVLRQSATHWQSTAVAFTGLIFG